MIVPKDIIQNLIDIASMSTSNKRKVAAIIVEDSTGKTIAYGFNHVLYDAFAPCEVILYNKMYTRDDVIHAEMDAINNFNLLGILTFSGMTMYVSYTPCINCRAALQRLGLKFVVIKDEGDLECLK